jgi:hypothetical protein
MQRTWSRAIETPAKDVGYESDLPVRAERENFLPDGPGKRIQYRVCLYSTPRKHLMKIILFIFAAVLAVIAIQKARKKDWTAAAACLAIAAIDLWMAFSTKN